MNSHADNEVLVKSCSEIFEAYSTIAIAKEEKLFISPTGNMTLQEVANQIISEKKSGSTYKPITLTGKDGLQYTIEIKKDTKKTDYKIILKPKSNVPTTDKHIQLLCKASSEDNLSNQTITMMKGKGNTYGIGVKLTKTKKNKNGKFDVIRLGGPEKIDLYSEHLATLHKMQEHLHDHPDDLASMLIALATGSGKTYVQALWFLVLNLAEMHGVFALPNNLLDQYKDDFSRLLPKSLVDKIYVLKENESSVAADAQLLKMSDSETPVYIAASYERLLSDTKLFNQLCETENVFLSFDEQHIAVTQELRKVRLFELAKRNRTMFLTATPNKETYDNCNQKPVATMSNRQKEAAGHGRTGEIHQVNERKTDDQLKQLNTDGKSEGINFSDSLLLGLTDIFEPQKSSPILSLLENLQSENPSSYYEEKLTVPKIQEGDDEYHQLRWKFQPPTAGKMLALIDNNQELINLDRFINYTDSYGDRKVNIQVNKSHDKEIEFKEDDKNIIYVYRPKGSYKWEVCVYYDIMFLPVIIDLPNPLTDASFKLSQPIYNKIIMSETLSELEKNQLAEAIDNYCKENVNFYKKQMVAKKLPVYTNGNAMDRSEAYQALLQEENDVDKKISLQYSEKKKKDYAEGITDLSKQSPNIGSLSKISLSCQLDNNIFSGIVDYAFSGILDLPYSELDSMRFHDYDTFSKKMKSALKHFNNKYDTKDKIENYFFNKLSSQIDEEGARKVSQLITKILTKYFNFKYKAGDTTLVIQHFFENWTMLNHFRDEMFKDSAFTTAFDDYAKDHRVLYVINGLDEAETKINSDQVFSGFSETCVKIHDDNGNIVADAKQRNRTIFEEFSLSATELQYKPTYNNQITESRADKYFKLGLVGMYVSNKKSEGFNDPALQTVITSIPSESDSNNLPSKRVQQFGRIRGLMRHKKPHFFTAQANNFQVAFDLNTLKEVDDYYPAYLEAEKRLNIQNLKAVGESIANEIHDYLIKEFNEADHTPVNTFNEAIKLIVLRALRKINNNNSHQIDLSKQQLKIALRYALDHLDKKISNLEVPYKTSYLNSKIGSLLNSIYEVTYYFKSKDIVSKLEQTPAVTPADKIYKYILSNTNYGRLSESTSAYPELISLIAKRSHYIKEDITLAVLKSFTDDEYTEINATIKDYLLPLMVKSISPEKQSYCLEKANEFPDWLYIIATNMRSIEKCNFDDPKQSSDLAIRLFKYVPDLKYYLSEKKDGCDAEKLASHASSFIEERAKESINDGAMNDAANYFHTEFLNQLKPLLVKKDYRVIQHILSDKNNALHFAKSLKDITIETPEEGLSHFIDLFKNQYPAVSSVQLLNSRANAASKSLSALVEKIENLEKETTGVCFTEKRNELMTWIASLLKEDEKQNLNNLFNLSVLPILAKYFDKDFQPIIFNELKDFNQWHVILFNLADSELLKKIEISDSEEEKNDLLSMLAFQIIKDTGKFSDFLPDARNYKAHAEEKLEKIQNTLPEKIKNSMVSVSGLFGVGETALQTYLSGEFLNDIEPFFLQSDLETLNVLFSNKIIASEFSKYILAKARNKFGSMIVSIFSKDKMSGETDENPFEWMKEFFKTFRNGVLFEKVNNIEPVYKHMESTFELLRTTNESYQADLHKETPRLRYFTHHPQDLPEGLQFLNQEYKDGVKSIVKDQLIDIILCTIPDEYKKIVSKECEAYSEWPMLLAKHKDSLEELEENEKEEDIIKVIHSIINDIPALNGMIQLEQLINPVDAKNSLQKSLDEVSQLKPPYNKEAIAALSIVLTDSETINQLRFLLLESDWKILTSILEKEGNGDKLSTAIINHISKMIEKEGIQNVALDLPDLLALIRDTFSTDPAYDYFHLDENNKIKVISDFASEEFAQYVNKGFKSEFKRKFNELDQNDQFLDRTFKRYLIKVLKLGGLKKLIDSTLGDISNDQLPDIIKIISPSEPNPADLTKQLFNLRNLIIKGKYVDIFDQYLKNDLSKLARDQLVNDQTDASTDNILLLKLINTIKKILVLQLDAHRHFNNLPVSDNILIDKLSVPVKQIKTEDTQIECNMFNANAMNIAMASNSETRAMNNMRMIDNLHLANELVKTIVSTMDHSISLDDDVSQQKRTLHEDVVQFGKEIMLLQPIDIEYAFSENAPKDTIQPLIDKVKGKANNELVTWWANISAPSTFIEKIRGRADELTKLDKLIQKCDIRNNQDLIAIEKESAHFLDNGMNRLFSKQYHSINHLHHKIYDAMVLNTASINPENMKLAIYTIKDYLVNTMKEMSPTETDLKKYNFNSTTLNKIKNILLEDLSDAEKIVKIRECAYSYDDNKTTRYFSHFFDSTKQREGKYTNYLCKKILNNSLYEDDSKTNNIENFIQDLSLSRKNN